MNWIISLVFKGSRWFLIMVANLKEKKNKQKTKQKQQKIIQIFNTFLTNFVLLGQEMGTGKYQPLPREMPIRGNTQRETPSTL